jgi:uncharacterized protein with PQ loop repeat
MSPEAILEIIMSTPVGAIAVFLQVGALTWGYGRQAILLRRKKDSSAHSLIFHILPTLACVAWGLHAVYESHSMMLAVSSIIGGTVGAIVTC